MYYKVIFMFILFNYHYSLTCIECHEINQEHQEFVNIVKYWADSIGRELSIMSEEVTRRNKVIESFKQTKVVFQNGSKLTEDIADRLKTMMAQKEEIVKEIADKAEILSYRRKENILENSTFDYYDTDNITNTTTDSDFEETLSFHRLERDRHFECEYNFHNDPTNNQCLKIPYIERPAGYFRHLPLLYHPHFRTSVNINYSVSRISISIFDRDEDILNDVRWSEPLDLVFKKNYEADPTLTWQYFAGTTGFFRHYPAIQWSNEKYDRTYDFRTRAWYLEAISSPKDVIILMDRSGSMWRQKWNTAKFLVNNILDTLGDNDYVNVYLFNNETHPLVDCFKYKLMQAHEENLRLVRESLDKHIPDLTGNIVVAFKMAFETLAKYREIGGKAHCNQVIMLISEGIDYDYDPAELFKTYAREEDHYTPVRVFTFLIGTSPNDAVQMQWIACANMGYYVNITLNSEIAEKVLKYLLVLSRPLNLNSDTKPEPIWTSVYADLGDRRLTNWLWNKFEGNTQRRIFMEYTQEAYKQFNCIFDSDTSNHFVRQTEHEYKKYLDKQDYTYMTTVSLPVYDRRAEKPEVLGVAAIDVPIDFIRTLTMPHRIGVNGYAFLLTNNGFLLLHPDHRKEFGNPKIIKPTFNRVDLTEVEIIDDSNEPREFNIELLKMRDKIVRQVTDSGQFNVKTHLDNMKRVILSKRHYFFTKVGLYTLVVALPDNYGFYKVRHDGENLADLLPNVEYIRKAKNWMVHPQWLYCKQYTSDHLNFTSTESELLYYLNKLEPSWIQKNKYCYPGLINSLSLDIRATDWFQNSDSNLKWETVLKKYQVIVAFMATHSGLTRWKNGIFDETQTDFIKTNNKAIDEVWYKRAVDYNYKNPKSFIYSVPYKAGTNSTNITASNAIYHEGGTKKAAIAVVGFQFQYMALEYIFMQIVSECGNKNCPYACDSEEISCFILDNNAYVMASIDVQHLGNFIGNIKPSIMAMLVKNDIFRQTRFFDYQDTCFIDPPKPQSKSPATRKVSIFQNIISVITGLFTYATCFIKSVFGAATKENPCLRAITSDYNQRAIKKRLPTPCDRQMWLYTMEHNKFTEINEDMPDCLWSFIAQPIPSTNLILLVINENRSCFVNSINHYPFTPEPIELSYNLSMPCYIATKNNYTRRPDISCINKHKTENELNAKDRKYCGITWPQ